MGNRILIIEDDAVTRQILDVRLKASGYDTFLAYDGIMALQVAQKTKPDLILLDLGLPGGDGFNVMQRFRQLGQFSSVPIIVFSARDSAHLEERSLREGAAAFFSKPLNMEALLASIRSRLPTEASEFPQTKTRKKILIVEDDADTRLALSLRLKANGYTVAVAADSVSAMGIGLKEKPALVILDIGLPGGDGYLLMERFKKHPTLAGSPIIVLTALDSATHKEKALKGGAVAFFQKPADNEEFLAAISKALD
jgi:DNA-binding response OmpR family regulator